MEKQITLEQTIDDGARALKASLYVQWGGNVLAYDPVAMTVDVQPNPSDMRTDVDTGQPYAEPWPVIKGVPVAWPRFGGFVLVGPLKVGDPVTLEAFDLDPTTWLAQGRSTQPVAPAVLHRLSGGFWKATPTDLTGPIKDAAAAAAAFLLGLDGDAAQILISAAQLIVGKSGCSVQLAGGGAAVGRVGDAIDFSSFTVTAPSGGSGGLCTLGGSLKIGAGSPSVTSG